MRDDSRAQGRRDPEDVLTAYLDAQSAGVTLDLGVLCEGDEALREAVELLLEDVQRAERALVRISGGATRRESDGAAPLAVLGAGDVLGGHRIIRCIGRGGSAVVFEAVDPHLARTVALKVVRGSPGETRAVRFRREVELAGSLRHENIVPIYATGTEGELIWLSMPLLSGPGLDRVGAPLDPRRAAEIALRVADALAAAHEIGILHRDVKPANIVLDEGTPYLVDFGLARALTSQEVTEVGATPGTLGFLAPEQLEQGGFTWDVRVDIYGLGGTLYELLGGRPPFADPLPERLMRLIVTRDPPRLKLDRAHRDLEAIVYRSLEKDPRRRFPSATAFAEDLKRYLQGRPVLSKPASIWDRCWRIIRRNPVASAGVMVGLLAALAAGLVFLRAESERRERHRAGWARAERSLSAGDFEAAREALRDVERAEGAPFFQRIAAEEELSLLIDGLCNETTLGAQDLAVLADTMQRGFKGQMPVHGRMALAVLDHRSGDAASAAHRLEQCGTLPRAQAGWQAFLSGSDVLAAVRGTPPASDPYDHLFSALVLVTSGHPYSAAESELEEVRTARMPYSAAYLLGATYQNQGRPHLARALYGTFADHERRRPMVWAARARTELLVGRVARGEELLLLAKAELSHRAAFARLPVEIVGLEFDLGLERWEAFDERKRRVLAASPGHAWVHALDGLRRARVGDREQARLLFRRALEGLRVPGTRLRVLVNLAELDGLDWMDAARADRGRVAPPEPAFVATWEDLLARASHLGDGPSAATAALWVSRIRFAAGRFSDAFAALRLALVHDPGHVGATVALVWRVAQGLRWEDFSEQLGAAPEPFVAEALERAERLLNPGGSENWVLSAEDRQTLLGAAMVLAERSGAAGTRDRHARALWELAGEAPGVLPALGVTAERFSRWAGR